MNFGRGGGFIKPTEECITVSRANQSYRGGSTYILAFCKEFVGALEFVWVYGSSCRGVSIDLYFDKALVRAYTSSRDCQGGMLDQCILIRARIATCDHCVLTAFGHAICWRRKLRNPNPKLFTLNKRSIYEFL